MLNIIDPHARNRKKVGLKLRCMKVNKELTALCRRFAAAGLKVTERIRDNYRGAIVRSIATDSCKIKFIKSDSPKIYTVSDHYMMITGLCPYVVTISIYNDILELIIE